MLNHCVVHLKLKQYCMSVVIKNKILKSVLDHLDKILHGILKFSTNLWYFNHN